MTYLDPNHARPQPEIGKWLLRVFVLAALLAFGWFALGVGDGSDGPTTIVSEPASRTF